MISILFGLGSALSWGAGDFTGGLASRKAGALRAVFYGEIIGLTLVYLIASASAEPLPALRVWALSAAAGGLGTIGLLLLYQAMTRGLMSIATPVSALLAAVLPVIVGALIDGLPSWPTFLGFGFALAAVWLISRAEGNDSHILAHLADLRLPLLAGIGFGCYFVLIHSATREATLWPMVASRLGGMLVLITGMGARRESLRIPQGAWGFILLNGILDVGGNAFYILAGQAGRLDVAAVLSSLYPGATVMLAWIFLRERLSRNQWLGIGAALLAIVLMTF